MFKPEVGSKVEWLHTTSTTDKTKDFLRDFFKTLCPGGQKHLAEDVFKCANDEGLQHLAQSIRTGLMIPIRAQAGKTPTDITPSPCTHTWDPKLNIEPSSRGPQGRLQRHCLERDGFKRLATGMYSADDTHPRNAPADFLGAAHIIPFALGPFQAKDAASVGRDAQIWVSLRRYFPALRSISFGPDQINSKKNVLMLQNSTHRLFGQFKLIFEPTATAPIRALPKSRLVKFKVHKGNGNFQIQHFSESIETL